MTAFPFSIEQEAEHGRFELLLLSLAALFVLVNFISLNLSLGEQIEVALYLPLAVWLLVFLAAYALLARFQPAHDPYILPIVALLTGWGLTLISRLAENFLIRQLAWVILGVLLLVLIALLPRNLKWLRRYRYTLLIFGLLLLGATLIFGVNPSGFGAALWLPVPFIGQIYFQPSELLKLLLVIFLASYFEERESLFQTQNNHGRFGQLPYLAPLLLMWGFCSILLVWQRDLGAATLFFILFLALLYLASGDWRYVVSGLVLLLLATVFAYFAFDVVNLRVQAWWNPWPDAANRSFQIVQSLYAVAAGGLSGQGIGQGFPIYIPVVHSDFAFAAIAEEWGLIGSLAVVICFMVLAYRGFLMAMRSPRPFRRYMAAGMTILLSAQALLIMGGVTKLLPLTGVTLPFLSYGGSSMILSCLMAGLLLYLSEPPRQERRHSATPQPAISRRLVRLAAAFLVGFILVALSLIYWGVLRAETILAREDNPRLVETELRIQRGQIVDRYGVILAETAGAGNELHRLYPEGSIPAVGYYNFRHGTAGIEEGLDTILRGDSDDTLAEIRRQTLHLPQVGRDVQLTLDAELQAQADALLGSQKGAALIIDLRNGEILSMVSHPAYDPNNLEAEFDVLVEAADAPLLNRAVQGQYQPGLMLQPLLLSEAQTQGLIDWDEQVSEPNRPVAVAGNLLHCERPLPGSAVWSDVLRNRCPAPMQELGEIIGPTGLDSIFQSYGFSENPTLPINTETNEVAATIAADLAAVGQENLLVTPLQLGLAYGQMMRVNPQPAPQLVFAIRNEQGIWEPVPAAAKNEAEAEGQFPAGESAAFITQLLVEEGNIEFSDLVLSGPEGSTNAWYVGLAPETQPDYLVVVLVEESGDLQQIEAIGSSLLTAVIKEQD